MMNLDPSERVYKAFIISILKHPTNLSDAVLYKSLD